MANKTQYPGKPSKNCCGRFVSGNHFCKNLAGGFSISSDIIDVLLEHSFEAFLDNHACNAVSWATSCGHILLFSNRCINVFWVPWSKSENIFMINKLSHHLNLTILNILELYSHVTDDRIIKTSLTLVMMWSGDNPFATVVLNTSVSFLLEDMLRCTLHCLEPLIEIDVGIVYHSVDLT